jgi:prepilin-type N-terminal cleavage/methylation domain-containing protein
MVFHRQLITLPKHPGFTLVELLIIIAVLSILAAVVFVALNPLARFQDARNSLRQTDVNNIIGAIKMYQVDHGGKYLSDIENLSADKTYQIGNAASNCDIICANPTVTLQSACVNIGDLADNHYLSSIPIDPIASGASADNSHYYLTKNINGSISVGSCDEEKGSAETPEAIVVTR